MSYTRILTFLLQEEFLVEGEGFEPSKLTQQIYSLPPFDRSGIPPKENASLLATQISVRIYFFLFISLKISKLLLLNTIYLN